MCCAEIKKLFTVAIVNYVGLNCSADLVNSPGIEKYASNNLLDSFFPVLDNSLVCLLGWDLGWLFNTLLVLGMGYNEEFL